MTAQIDDVFKYQRRRYSIAGISEDEFFEIGSLGLDPVSPHTACWRGYQAVFSISESRLVLSELLVNLISPTEDNPYEPAIGPVINGISPIPSRKQFDPFNNVYKGLNYDIGYSGGLLIAREFIESLYVHMGFHPAWKYEEVVELIFDEGILTQAFDRSEQMTEIRARLSDSSNERASNPSSHDDIITFIDRAFDRRY